MTGVAALLLGLVIGLVYAVFSERDHIDQYRYHIWRWEADTLTANAFARLGIAPSRSDGESEEAIRNYFRITSQLRTVLDTDPANGVLIDALASERSVYENDVERFIEGQIDGVIAATGLQRALPFFNSARITWPPVDFELTTPPQLLVRSPRDRIERAGDTLLKPGLSFAEIQDLEDREAGDSTVTLVVSIGGLAAYPAIVTGDRSYDGLLDTSAHEWVHHYLAFYPLGEEWDRGGDAHVLNETTANIAGREIANIIRREHPIDLAQGEDGRALPRPESLQVPVTVDFNVEMRKLRLEVDRLLGEGRVDEAEALMEETRLHLQENGIFIRKLNQAYFAFYGTYGDSPASSDPVGPKIERVWEITQDVGLFLRVMRDVRNLEDLDASLAALEAAADPSPGQRAAP
jgi:hypothetical protein